MEHMKILHRCVFSTHSGKKAINHLILHNIIYMCILKMWIILKEMRIPDHLTCLMRNLYAVQEATVRTRHETMDWFQIGKGVYRDCIVILLI